MDNFTVKPDLGLYDPNTYFNKHNSPFDVAAHTHYICESGSHAYGTNTSESDLDLRGIFLEPLSFVFGLNKIEQISNQDSVEGQAFKNDVCFYSLRRFVAMAYKNGPHILEMLHCDSKSIHLVTPVMQKLLDHKNKFLSNQLQYSFGGYAFTQLMKMKTKIANHTGRKALIEKYFYDPKLYSHSIRLYRMAKECLLTGKLNVLRLDAKELLEIRNGKYTYEEAVVFADVTDPKTGKLKTTLVGGFAFEEQQKFLAACNQSILPEHPNFDFINNLLIDIQREYYWSI
jgi:predicted nucleotidyltransferase